MTGDIGAILDWSLARFGEAARQRYAALMVAGLRDVARDPCGLGTKDRPELGEGVRTWCLALSRAPVAGMPVHQPRHILVYRLDGPIVVIGRVLHDSMDPEHHLDSGAAWR